MGMSILVVLTQLCRNIYSTTRCWWFIYHLKITGFICLTRRYMDLIWLLFWTLLCVPHTLHKHIHTLIHLPADINYTYTTTPLHSNQNSHKFLFGYCTGALACRCLRPTNACQKIRQFSFTQSSVWSGREFVSWCSYIVCAVWCVPHISSVVPTIS